MSAKLLRVVALAAALFPVSVAPGQAGDAAVTLTRPDTPLRIEGTLLSHDGEVYRLRTPDGELSVAAQGLSCTGPGCPAVPPLPLVRLSGAPALAEIALPRLLAAFAAGRGLTLARVDSPDTAPRRYRFLAGDGTPVAEAALHATSTAEGLADLIAREADIALARRPATDAERRIAQEAGLGDLAAAAQTRVLGHDALVVVAAPGQQVRAIAPGMLSRVLSGDVFSWAALGGEEAPIHVLLPPRGGTLSRMLRARLMPAGGNRMPAGTRMADAAALARAVARDPLALGVTWLSETGESVPLAIAWGCGRSVAPTAAALRAGDYPFTVQPRLYLPARRLPRLARDFLGWIDSDAAQRALSGAGFAGSDWQPVPLPQNGTRLVNAIGAATAPDEMAALQRLARSLDGAGRLPLGLRPDAGDGPQPDSAAQAALHRLADRLAAGQFDDQTLLLLGFTDRTDNPESDRARSQALADAARRVLEAAAGPAPLERVQIDTAGQGALMPLACDEDATGRALNRRVEIWLRPQR